MSKRLCVLQVTPEKPSAKHMEYFKDKPDCDFFFVTHDVENPDALQFCPNTTWTDTRNVLADKVPKDYDYYAFVDYDYIFHPQKDKNVLDQMLEDLNEYNPAVLSYYPGKVGLNTPFATDDEYFNKFEYSTIPFTHCGLKVVHKSLMDWFFPMVTKFGGGVEACHLFNILEIPFLEHMVVSHKMTYDNGNTDLDAPHNRDGFKNKVQMDRMWTWIYPYYNARLFLRDSQIQGRFGDNIPARIEEYSSYSDSLYIKNLFQHIFKNQEMLPVPSSRDVDYSNHPNKSLFFDLSHEHFTKVPKNDILVIIGNGPSLKQEHIDLIKEKNIDSFGLNTAYRFFEKTGWYPKYYGCFDYALCESHKEEWSKMIDDPNCPIEKFFLIERPSIEALLPHTSCYFDDHIRTHNKFVERPHNQDGIGHPHFGTRNRKVSCTGANAVRTGAELGYKKIILVGHDASYVQCSDLKEAEFVKGCRFVVKDEIKKNPNYFWDDYQQQGDLFHSPGDPRPAWRNLAECLKMFAPDVDVVNCSPESKLDCFRFGNFNDEIK